MVNIYILSAKTYCFDKYRLFDQEQYGVSRIYFVTRDNQNNINNLSSLSFTSRPEAINFRNFLFFFLIQIFRKKHLIYDFGCII